MAAHDSSWDIFRAELKRWMELRRVTNKALAESLNEDLPSTGLTMPINEQIIKRWRHSTSPPLQSLKVIARILQMSGDPTGQASFDPTYLPRVMGILDEAPDNGELIAAAYRLQAIRTQIADAQSALISASEDGGAARIARAATRSGLGYAVWPVLEGPAGYPMHVSDRVDFRNPQDPTTPPEPQDFPEVADALHDGFAVRSRRSPRFSGETSPPGTAQWAVQHVGRPRTSLMYHQHPGLQAVTITSVTTVPWVDDIGDLLALLLGYGFTATRELARELVSDPYSAEPLRADIHENFLFLATPSRRVWTHHGATLHESTPMAPFLDNQGRASKDLLRIHLIEDDASLRHAATYPPGTLGERPAAEIEADFSRFREARDKMAERAHQLAGTGRIFPLEVTFQEAPQDRWEQVFRRTLDCLKIIDELGIDVQLDELHERLARRDPSVAPHVLRWMADREAPFVDPRYRTS